MHTQAKRRRVCTALTCKQEARTNTKTGQELRKLCSKHQSNKHPNPTNKHQVLGTSRIHKQAP
eukprot:1144591-Pelagomonas_calceolata.AAC.1